MLNQNHKNLDVWQASINFTTKMYKLTNDFPNSELYGLVSQIRRSAVSVPSNLSEGAARKSKQDRLRFYQIARSSLVEIDTQLEISLRLNYVTKDNMIEIDKELNHIFAMLSQLRKNTKN